MDTSKTSTASKISEDQCFELLYIAKLFQLINVRIPILNIIGLGRNEEMF